MAPHTQSKNAMSSPIHPGTDIELGELPSVRPFADEDEAACAICLNDTSSLSTPLHVTQCAHQFCEQCLIAYLLKKPADAAIPCPLCRSPLADEEIPRTFTIPVAKPINRTARLGLSLITEEADSNGAAAANGGSGRQVGDQGVVRIRSVSTGSAAEAAGLRKGMALLAINGERVASVAQAIERLNLLRQRGFLTASNARC